MSVNSTGGRKHFMTFINDYSCCCVVSFLRQKSELLEKFKEFEAITPSESDFTVGTLQTMEGNINRELPQR